MAQISEITFEDLVKNQRIDAEYFQPAFLKLNHSLSHLANKKIGKIGYVTDGEHGAVELLGEGIRYLMAENIHAGYVTIEGVRYVSETVHDKNKRASVKAGDILISIKGTLGVAAVAEKWLEPANLSRDVAIIKLKDRNFLPEYVCAYLMSHVGKIIALREGSGGVQQMITLGRLRELRVPKLEIAKQQKIADLYREALAENERFKSLYMEAEDLLLKELELQDFAPEWVVGYETDCSSILNATRMDAEYFVPKYTILLNKIEHCSQPLLALCSIGRGSMISMEFYNENMGTPYLRGADFSSFELGSDKLIYIDPSFVPTNETKVEEGDIIFASIGSVGTTALIRKEFSGSFISNNTGRIRVKSKDISSDYLQVVLRSAIGQAQFKREQTQTAQPKISNDQISAIQIPVLAKPIRDKITKLAQESHASLSVSRQLLEDAKFEVEQLINDESK